LEAIEKGCGSIATEPIAPNSRRIMSQMDDDGALPG